MDTPVELKPRQPLETISDEWAGMRGRWILPPVGPRPEGWSDFVFSEWELEGGTWTDLHHHDEHNYVIEGELHVESEGTTVVARPGDTVTVRAGHLGSYSAPTYARMVAVYGPNPGEPDEHFSFVPHQAGE